MGLSLFIFHAFKKDLIKNGYIIKGRCETVASLQANSIPEQIQQFISNSAHNFDLQNNYLDEEDPWGGILASTDFLVQSRYHITLQATPCQLVSGRDMILNTPFIDDWECIRRRKQELMDK